MTYRWRWPDWRWGDPEIDRYRRPAVGAHRSGGSRTGDTRITYRAPGHAAVGVIRVTAGGMDGPRSANAP
jgi:hypothetical protein